MVRCALILTVYLTTTMSSAKVDEDVVVVLPATPPESPQVNRYSKQTVDRDSLLIPTISHHERPHNHSHDDQQSKPQAQILTALAVGVSLLLLQCIINTE